MYKKHGLIGFTILVVVLVPLFAACGGSGSNSSSSGGGSSNSSSIQTSFVPNFTPSTNGFHFSNSFPSGEPYTIPLANGVSIALGDASNGLCGGMVFAARDLYEARLLPPAATTVPPGNSRQFNYLVERQLASLGGGAKYGGPTEIDKYYDWMHIPNHDTVLGPSGLAHRTIVDEWPQVKADIDNRHPSPLGLIEVYSWDPTLMGKNHQVLAYGYELNTTTQDLVLHVYDPNVPDQDTTLSMNIGNPAHTSPIADSAGDMVRGFFHIDSYNPVYPEPFVAHAAVPIRTPVAEGDCNGLIPIRLPDSAANLYLTDPSGNKDTLHVEFQHNLSSDDLITFTLITAPQVTWWKGLEVHDTNDSIVGSAYTVNSNHGPVSTTINVTNYYAGLKLVLLKAKVFGVHTAMYCVSDLEAVRGETVTITWEAD